MSGRKKFAGFGRDEQIGLMFDLIQAFSQVKTPYKTALLLQDLLTANEIRNLSIRLRIAKLLLAGEKQRDISHSTHSSLATISKIKSWLDAGGSGLKDVIKKLPIKWDMPENLPKIPVEFRLPQTLVSVIEYSIAKSQNRPVEEFIKGVKNKKDMDRLIRKYYQGIYQKYNA